MTGRSVSATAITAGGLVKNPNCHEVVRQLSISPQLPALFSEPGMLSPQASISVIIPTLNEEKNIPWVLRRMPSYVDEVIIVDGRSQDNTVEVAKAVRPDVVVV